MPILFMGLVALAVFLSMFFMFLAAMTAERRKRDELEAAQTEPPKVKAQAAGQ